ncbi:GNAT family N-acetyltransferase [Micromonospora avicenniae]|uniref:Ribosomal protein S18 acetylase RimI n=1 Tax=Micromonospora avicenniae TaxID=1198245 RepID=A0A1N6X2V0_9ACTN|nr:GNAT family N-acetyltransferase [Micromonospora avicenniae]SIQ96646.1 Ribosomal protein S18 acetylase RimI [Micromonospora avicenniae]
MGAVLNPTTTGTVVAPTRPDDPVVTAAARLLAESVPSSCAGLVAYHASNYAAFLAASLAPPPPLHTLLLRCFCDETGVRAAADWRLLGRRLLLNGIAVRAQDQGRGHGSRLLDDGVRLANQLGCDQLLLDVSLENTVARRLYRRAGYQDQSYQVWTQLDAATSPADTPVRIVDWASFTAHRRAYGFGDLRVRVGDDEFGVRCVANAARVPGGAAGAAIRATLGPLLGIDRWYMTTASAEPETEPGFARFARMWRGLPG